MNRLVGQPRYLLGRIGLLGKAVLFVPTVGRTEAAVWVGAAGGWCREGLYRARLSEHAVDADNPFYLARTISPLGVGVSDHWAIEMVDVSKRYGPSKAIDALTLKIAKGTTLGLIGQTSQATTRRNVLFDCDPLALQRWRRRMLDRRI